MHLVNVPAELIFQALADPTRVRALRVLAATGAEACLCELVDSLHEPQYKLSRHLKLLRQVGLLSAQKDGRFVYHRLVMRPGHLKRLAAMIRALPETPAFAADLRRFRQRMQLREAGRCRIGIQTPFLTATRSDARLKRSA